MKKSHMSFVVFMFSLFFFCNSLSFAANDDWTNINGTVSYNGTPVCAMVLANGQYMFSCAGNGEYELEVPLDANGEITLFAFVDGLAPFKQILTPSEALDFDIEMQLASPDSKTPTVTSIAVESIDNPGWIDIAGSVALEGTPLCAMVLANGQYMFSCDPIGEYLLSVPLDSNGEITLFAFVDGLAPYKEIFSKYLPPPSSGISTVAQVKQGQDDQTLIGQTVIMQGIATTQLDGDDYIFADTTGSIKVEWEGPPSLPLNQPIEVTGEVESDEVEVSTFREL